METITLNQFLLQGGRILHNLEVVYKIVGRPLESAPLIVINHALTGNADLASENGWWKEQVGYEKSVDLNEYCVLSINIPGNGFGNLSNEDFENYRDFSVRDIAAIFWEVLFKLEVQEVFALIGPSLGGCIAWEMLALQSKRIQNFIAIASHYKPSDWLIANVHIQDILLSRSETVNDARKHAMLLYRSPESLREKFQTSRNSDSYYKVEEWLNFHGDQLQKRFSLSSYKLINHLLRTGKALEKENFQNFSKDVSTMTHLVGIDSDLLFRDREIYNSALEMQQSKSNVFYHQIQSIHGHDAFLIENNQVSKILKSVFNTQKSHNYVNSNN